MDKVELFKRTIAHHDDDFLSYLKKMLQRTDVQRNVFDRDHLLHDGGGFGATHHIQSGTLCGSNR